MIELVRQFRSQILFAKNSFSLLICKAKKVDLTSDELKIKEIKDFKAWVASSPKYLLNTLLVFPAIQPEDSGVCINHSHNWYIRIKESIVC